MNDSPIRAYITHRLEQLEREKPDQMQTYGGDPSVHARIDELQTLLRLVDGLDKQMELLRKAIFQNGL